MKKLHSVIAVIVFMAASCVYGQAEVEDRIVLSQKTANAKPANAESLGELYYQIQTLQQEVLQLRGLVEEQTFHIKKLKQQRLDDYVDLDRRISQLSGSSGTSAPSNVANPSSTATPSTSSTVNAAIKEEEFSRYKDAYRLAKQDPVKAEEALKKFIQDFPQSKYVANGLFVLGELKFKSSELEDARAWYMRVVLEHPQHYRASNAKLKLGQVFQQMGNMTQAKQYWTEVAATNSSAAAKAKSLLAEYF